MFQLEVLVANKENKSRLVKEKNDFWRGWKLHNRQEGWIHRLGQEHRWTKHSQDPAKRAICAGCPIGTGPAWESQLCCWHLLPLHIYSHASELTVSLYIQWLDWHYQNQLLINQKDYHSLSVSMLSIRALCFLFLPLGFSQTKKVSMYWVTKTRTDLYKNIQEM